LKPKTKIFLFSDDVTIIDAVFGYILKKNIFDGTDIEVFRKREIDNLNFVDQFDLIFVDDKVSDGDIQKALKSSSIPCILKVVHHCDSSIRIFNPKATEIDVKEIKMYLCHYLDLLSKDKEIAVTMK
jgi:hypothetical protein